MPPKLRNIIYDWAVERNYDVSDIKIGNKKVKNNLENYFLHVVGSPSKDNMYTTFENFKSC